MRTNKFLVFVAIIALAGFFSGGKCGGSNGNGGGGNGDLVGTWVSPDGVDKITFGSDGSYTEHYDYEYSILDSGQILEIDDWEYDRTAGSGETVVGTWSDGDEIIQFNSDKSYTWDYGGGDIESGTYNINGNIINFSFSCTYTATTTTITVDYGSFSETYDYTLNGNSLILSYGGFSVTFTRQ